ncbi:hypothetical protein [Streptomyces sp. NBC_00687]|uniref:hypothetical protein n=1 Tax=Streptomyces sp. NBC_00687 TaxID=2975807 RepID=UPI00225A60DF|nr:hypothetical protein [Streptomyces sp. NBC_00687]MCX4912788.1 hypothetical protein [Streptomyces sp. NBC_00687]
MTAVFEVFTTAGPWALAAFLLFVALFMAGAIAALCVALRSTKGSERPEIIRALADLFGSLFWRRR